MMLLALMLTSTKTDFCKGCLSGWAKCFAQPRLNEPGRERKRRFSPLKGAIEHSARRVTLGQGRQGARAIRVVWRPFDDVEKLVVLILESMDELVQEHAAQDIRLGPGRSGQDDDRTLETEAHRGLHLWRNPELDAFRER